MPNKSNRTIIIVLLLTALVVRLIALKQNYLIVNDGTLYIKLAKLYWAGGNLDEILKTYPYHAFFSLLIFSLHKIIGDWILAGNLVSILCGTLTVIPLYLLARMIFDEKVALFASIFYIICPNLVRYSTEILKNIPFVFFYMMALWWGYKGIKDGKLIFLGSSALFIVLSALFRIEGLILFASLSFFLFWNGIKNNIPWKKILNSFSVFLASSICILALFGMLTILKGSYGTAKQILRTKTVTRSIQNTTIKNIEKEVTEKDISQKGKQFFYLAKDYRFILYLSHIFYKAAKVSDFLFILFFLGLIKRKREKYRPDEILALALYAGFVPLFLFHLNNFISFSTRYPLPLVVPSLIWSGVGFVELQERVAGWLRKREFSLKKTILPWITPLLLLMICVPLLCMAWAPHRKDKMEIKEIGLWLKEHGYAHSVIIGQHEFTRLAFYADAEFVPLPKGTYQDIIRFLKGNKAKLLVINKNTINHFSPYFLDKVSPKDLQLINIPDIKTPQYATLVLKVKESGRNSIE